MEQWKKSDTLRDRVMRNVKKTRGCWLWTGTFNAYGYGVVGHKRNKYMAHRAAYQVHVGDIPKGLYVCHKCDNTKCVRPEHLFLGTQKDNMRDCSKKGRVHSGYKLSGEDVKKIRALDGKLFHREIAQKFGVSRSAVGAILSGKIWNTKRRTYG